MKELNKIKETAEALNVSKQLEKALQFFKSEGIENLNFDGFYPYHLDVKPQVERFKVDYSGTPQAIFFLSLEKDYKSFDHSLRVEIPNPDAQEKHYKEGINDRFTNFHSPQFLAKLAQETGFKLKHFQFGLAMIHLAILYDDNKPVKVMKPEQLKPIQEEKPKEKVKINKNKGDK